MQNRKEEKARSRTTRSCQVFISHDSRDAMLAEAFGNLLKTASAGKIKPFRSSDKSGTDGIDFGVEWYDTLMSKLDQASDVVCLLTERSLERPWILFEAGVAKGKLGTPVHGLRLGVHQVGSGPFFHFQNCDGTETSLLKLLRQLIRRVDGVEPNEKAIRAQIRAFSKTTQGILMTRPRHSGNTSWRRAIPLRHKLPALVLQSVDKQLDAVRREAKQFLDERGKLIQRKNIRTNLMLPDFQFQSKSQFPGQLYFLATRPKDSYSKQELSNRFAPGEGVSGKVFLDGLAFAEDGRAGVSARKLEVMPPQLSAVAGFPLLDRDMRYAFGVVCIDFLDAPKVDVQDLKHLLGYEPVLQPIQEIASLLSHDDNESFELEFAAHFLK